MWAAHQVWEQAAVRSHNQCNPVPRHRPDAAEVLPLPWPATPYRRSRSGHGRLSPAADLIARYRHHVRSMPAETHAARAERRPVRGRLRAVKVSLQGLPAQRTGHFQPEDSAEKVLPSTHDVQDVVVVARRQLGGSGIGGAGAARPVFMMLELCLRSRRRGRSGP